MNRILNTLGMASFAAVLGSLAGCAADSGCCGNCTDEKGAQVNASVMTEKSDCCAGKDAAECKDKTGTAAQPATAGGTSPEDINSLDRRLRFDESVKALSFEGGRVSVRPEFAVNRDAAASARAMAGFNDAWGMNHRDRATAYAADAVRFDPQSADAMIALGRSLMMKGKETEAIAAFNSTLAIRPDWIEARTELAMTYWRLNRMPEATAEFNRILEAQPNNGFALERMAIASYYAGDNAAAWRFVDRATAAGHQVPPQLIDQLGQRSR